MPKILIADDEPGMRVLLEQSLEDLEDKGVELLTARNGKETLEVIKKQRPELVLLDVMMPDISGFEICNIVKNELGMKDTYIMILTARNQEIEEDNEEGVCADFYMKKPFDMDKIIKKAAEVLGIEM